MFAAIDALATAPGLWVSGPAGFGKTTLVATWLEARGLPCAWLQLDVADADPSTFAHFLAGSAALIAPRRRLRLPLPTIDDLRDVPAFIRRCIRRMAASLDHPWVLVLDNAQEIDRASTLHAGIAAALSELPEGARVIAISREPPPPQYARALAGQQLAVLEASTLRFTADETQSLLTLHDRSWSADALRQATDGWAAAMILMLAAKSELPADVPSFEGVARPRLFDLFAGEVMAAMPQHEREALVRIAFLPSATAAMAVAVSGDARAGQLLADVARRSLFTDRRDAASPVYTFHALFGEFLRARAGHDLEPDALRSLRIEAAGVLAANGQTDAAVLRFIEAEAWGEALDLLVANAGRLVAQGRTATVREGFLALPEQWRASALACYWLGYCELAIDPAAALAQLERAHHGFAAVGDMRGSFYAAAAAADAIVFLGANYEALAPWMSLLEAYAGDYLAQRDPEQDLRVLPGLLAAFVHRDPGHALTASIADAAEEMLDQPPGASQRILLGTLAYYLLWTGQVPRLDRIVLKIDRMCAGGDAAPATLLRWHAVGVLVRSLLGRIDEALEHAGRALAIAQAGPAPMRAKAHLLMVLAALAARDAELARTHLTEAAGVLAAGNPVDVTTYEFQRGMLMLLDEDWRGAAQLMRAAVESGRASGWPLREHIALLGQALASTQVESFDEAEAALRAAFDHPFYAVCRWHHWIAALIEAHLAQRRGDHARALDALRRAFASGRAYGFDFGPMPYCCGDMMSRLAAVALENGIDPAFALQIVRRYALPAPPAAGANWPWPIRIRTLGAFSVERDGSAASVSRKESRKPLDLLKLLVALGAAAVPVARLCASLWPDAAGDAARNSFDNTLHRLRKLLGGDRHVHLRAGALSLDPSTCWTDVAALEACLAAPVVADAGSASAWVDRVLSLYQGEFLAGDDELPEVQVARARIQAMVGRQAAAQGARLEQEGRPEAAARLYRRVLEHQPLAEDIVRKLISCLLELGLRAEAMEAYRRCRQQLSVVLGVRPAAETEALVAGIPNL
ncbi:MAG: hypothetical protein KJZ83_12360 [Burkholderiaceae bacterium]|nr:hypothetical protein [Burkholderiaceae bacterium]